MGLNDTPSGERTHIGFFGKRNAGKSSLVNAVTDQDLSVVSEKAGTTTDPVYKSMEILPLGPVVIIDTPGWDDEGKLGQLRIQKTVQVLGKTDIAVLVADAVTGLTDCDRQLIQLFDERKLPFIIAFNKTDIIEKNGTKTDDLPDKNEESEKTVYVSAVSKSGIDRLKQMIASFAPREPEKRLVGDLLKKDDLVILVTPIDASAPKGRMILPEQQMLRDVLDADAIAIDVKETQLESVQKKLKEKPAMVITDSQAFAVVSRLVENSIPLTSFSILMARYKGFLDKAVEGVKTLDSIENNDKILIAEGCTHHRQCEDIGTVKLPNMIRKYTGKTPIFETSSGGGFPDDLTQYKLIVHCGACMLGETQVRSRLMQAISQNVPMTNYGISLAYMQGILKRCLSIIPGLAKKLDNTI